MARSPKGELALKAQARNNTKPVAAAKSTFREYAEVIALAIILALFIRAFIIQAYKIPSGSMLPTLEIGDQLLVVKCQYGIRLPIVGKRIIPFSTPKHGDVIVFVYPKDPSVDFIKRVIGTPGDKVEVRDKKVFINGQAIPDEHATHIDRNFEPSRDQFGPVVVPEGKLFVMGDNRDHSLDSRFWGFVDMDQVLGKALIIFWSWDKWRVRWDRLGDLVK